MTETVFAIRVGQDFAKTFVSGLEARFGHLPQLDFAQIAIYVNTRRMQRRLREVFDSGPARLLPKIGLITDLTDLAPDLAAHPTDSPLRLRLELAQLLRAKLAARMPDASTSARFELAESLLSLLAEIEGEGVPTDVLAKLDVSDESQHWKDSLDFIGIVQDFLAQRGGIRTGEARQRRIVDTLKERWARTPPKHPIIVAGSTGSRGTTADFMELVAGLPQGSVVLPGVDPHIPPEVWAKMDSATGAEDHPQFRFKALCDRLGLAPDALPDWSQGARRSLRDALVSLSLRPAPVTDQWITDGPALGQLGPATDTLTVIEAPNPRQEANAIAVRMRQAVEAGQTVALVSPDRGLTRRVASALERWDILPDDSAGSPLHLTPPGRFLRLCADLLDARVDVERLLSVLKHPLCNSGAARGAHLLHTQRLELDLRRYGPPFPGAEDLQNWAQKRKDDQPGLEDWTEWLAGLLPVQDRSERPLKDHLAAHIALAEALAAGPGQTGAGALWDKAAGRQARAVLSELDLSADLAGEMTALDFGILLGRQLAAGEVRDRDAGHPQVLIWGTLEARVQVPDVLILGGLNEGSWPEQPGPDPWLNRRMRKEAGLLLPERRIGLSAHDYQLAMAAPEVVMSRAIKSADAETVPSRWVNRLFNLLDGLEGTGGKDSLKAMRSRGADLLSIARDLETPAEDERVDPAPRPSPIPPVSARPRRLSVTRIKTLIRDPYAIYAQYVLGLKKLDPLTPTADAPLRGTITHKILERFMRTDPDPADPAARDSLMSIARQTMAEMCPWPTARRFWLARIEGFADTFLGDERGRSALASKMLLEQSGKITLDGIDFTLSGTADRIDLTQDGQAILYDYKTGTAPAPKVQTLFDKQLILEAAMVERGAFAEVGKPVVMRADFLQLSSEVKAVAAPIHEKPLDDFWDDFTKLMTRWAGEELGYTSRRANMSLEDKGDYDHLARYGEWDEAATPVKVKP